jgi:hypothetical protein
MPQITSTISMAWDFTTKFGGIWKILIPPPVGGNWSFISSGL